MKPTHIILATVIIITAHFSANAATGSVSSLPQFSDYTSLVPRFASADGSVMSGMAHKVQGRDRYVEPFVWSASSGYTGFGRASQTTGSSGAFLLGMSSDGNTVLFRDANRIPFLWKRGIGVGALPAPARVLSWGAHVLSSDGSTVAGVATWRTGDDLNSAPLVWKGSAAPQRWSNTGVWRDSDGAQTIEAITGISSDGATVYAKGIYAEVVLPDGDGGSDVFSRNCIHIWRGNIRPERKILNGAGYSPLFSWNARNSDQFFTNYGYHAYFLNAGGATVAYRNTNLNAATDSGEMFLLLLNSGSSDYTTPQQLALRYPYKTLLADGRIFSYLGTGDGIVLMRQSGAIRPLMEALRERGLATEYNTGAWSLIGVTSAMARSGSSLLLYTNIGTIVTLNDVFAPATVPASDKGTLFTAAAKFKPLVKVSETYAEKLTKQADKTYTETSAGVWAVTMKASMAGVDLSSVNGDTVISFEVGTYSFSKKLSESTNWKPGKKSAKWIIKTSVNGVDTTAITAIASWNTKTLNLSARCNRGNIFPIAYPSQLGWHGPVEESVQARIGFGTHFGIIDGVKMKGKAARAPKEFYNPVTFAFYALRLDTVNWSGRYSGATP